MSAGEIFGNQVTTKSGDETIGVTAVAGDDASRRVVIRICTDAGEISLRLTPASADALGIMLIRAAHMARGHF